MSANKLSFGKVIFPTSSAENGSILEKLILKDNIQTDSIMIKVIIAHGVLIPFLFGLPTGQFLNALIMSLLLSGISVLAIKSSPGSIKAQVIVGATMMGFSALTIQLLGGRIEAHFHIFAMVVAMVIYKDAWAMISAAVTIAIHHFTFNALQDSEIVLGDTPIVLFSYGCGVDIVLLHAAYVVLCLTMGLIISYRSNLSLFGMTEIQTELDELNQSADETADLSDSVASASNQNAQGATEQQSILETTIEGFAEVNGVMGTCVADVDISKTEMSTVKERMSQLEYAINEVRESGKQINTILNTIDTISFQTNLLALNASVEAARAGEAGAGFSVVAEEVRVLAKRSSEASKQIEELLNKNISSIDEANKRKEEMGTALSSFEGITSKIGSAVVTIRERSDEFTSQLNEVSSVSSRNVATAEETSSVSEELKNQSIRIRENIDSIMARY